MSPLKDVNKQLKEAVLTPLEVPHLGCVTPFANDNSMTPKKMPANCLYAAQLNLRDNSKDARASCRDGHFQRDVQQVSQRMLTEEGVQEVIETIHEGRGLWVNGTKHRDAR